MKGERQRLELEALTVGYNGRALIRDITLSLRRGEIMTLIGPNGSGKTTILKSISRHLAAVSGAVYIDSKSMRLMSGREVSTKMAVVLTDRTAPELTTCREMAAAGRYPYTGSFGLLTARDREIVENALAAVSVLDIADRDFSSVSDGQRQRILLARAICQQPEIIVLDEPTLYLDVKYKIGLLETLRRMAKEQGISIVMSLHELDLAAKISDKIVCVKGDRIKCWGTPGEIFSDENIASLYDMEKGSFNSLLGSIELPAPRGQTRCFVIGGCGCGIPFYRELQRKSIPFAAGILFENDIDLAVARVLAQETVVAEAFEQISQKLVDEAKRVIANAEFVIDSGCPVGRFNRANSELLTYAREKEKKIITGEKELAEVLL